MNKIILALTAILSIAGLSTSAQEPLKQKTINVAGMAEMEVVPDEIYVEVQLREYDRKGGSKADINDIRAAFLKSATGIGINESDISVKGYQGWDGNYWWYKKNKKKNPDMKASITYEVKLASTKKMDELVEKLDDEATENFFITRADHSKLQEFKKQLKIKAVQAAKEKANYLAEAIGEKVGEALIINDPNEIRPYPVYYSNAAMMQKRAVSDATEEAEPNVDFKKMKLQFEVNVTFALK